MKRIISLLIGMLAFSIACQEESVRPENEVALVEQSAKFEKIKTHHIKGWTEIIPDNDAPLVTCTPEDFGIQLCSSGWVNGKHNILGKVVQDQSTYEKQYCTVTMTEEGPVVLNVVTADVLRINGNRTFASSHTWINVATGEVWGYVELTGGTGRFEGITGKIHMSNGVLLPDGRLQWEDEGYITLAIK